MPEGQLDVVPAAGAEVRAFFGSLTEGTGLSSSGPTAADQARWTIESIHELRHGAIPVVLADARGRRFQVDVLRRDDAGDSAIAVAGGVALYLSNRGDGATGTLEEHGLGVMALASALRMQDRAPAPSGLTTFATRRTRHPLGAFSAG
ncbi:MAG: hypothetical protein GXP55_09930 [Deltaproteobacteria bacterium]|nr:hypothetical protein [Deltaproteobacteria bacterium]